MNNITIILTAFWGIFLLLSAAIISLVPSLRYDLVMNFRNRKLRLLGALLAGIIGVATISVHNIWTWDMSGVITLFGWSSLAKGITIAVYPKVINISEKIITSRWFGFYLLVLFSLGWYMLLWSIGKPINV